MTYKTITLGQAVLRASLNKEAYLLPAMQRPYVWEKKDAIKLFESIYKGFPIGTSLLWQTKACGDLKLGANRVYKIPSVKTDSNNLHDVNLMQDQDITLVLDGQQRLTTMNIALTGYWVGKNSNQTKMFFNLDVSPTDKEKEAFIITDDVYGINLIPCHDIMKWKTKELFNEYICETRISENTTWYTNITKLYSRIWQDEGFCFGECKAQSMGEAVEIFVASNSSGKSLDMTDLIMAYLSTSWDKIDAKNEVNNLVTSLNKMIKPRFFRTKSILKLFLSVTKDTDGKLLTASMTNILKSLNARLIMQLETQWEPFKKSMADICVLIERWGIKGDLLTSTNAIIPVLLWMMNNKMDIYSDTNDTKYNLELARRWLLASLSNGVFSGMSDVAINDIRKIIESNSNIFPLSALIKDPNRHGKHVLTSELEVRNFIDTLEYPKDSATILQLLFIIRGSYPLGIEQDTTYQLDQIFPKNDYKSVESINTIGNIQLLPSRDNKRKSNRHPRMLWDSDIYGLNFLGMNVLPINSVDLDNPSEYIYNLPEKLITNRKNELAEKIYYLLNDM